MKTLDDLYKGHTGKVSDKWALYLREYDRLFSPYRDQAITMLEIGVQNGGSLEIWSQYFANAKKFVGCDINPDCAKLTYDDLRVHIIVGDATLTETQQQILQQSNSYDLIIEDGSHTAGDIVKAFAKYFPALREGGLFVAEDLHCSYWQEFDGGLFAPYSSISFFKLLADVVNHEHWGISKARAQLVLGFKNKFNIDFNEDIFSEIYSIEFLNSLCIVKKQAQPKNQLGIRRIAGSEEVVVTGHLSLQGNESKALSQSENVWSVIDPSPAEQYEILNQAVGERDNQIASLSQRVGERDNQIASLSQRVGERDSQIASLNQALEERDRQLYDQGRQIADLSGEVLAIQNSKSWKITAPARSFFKNVRRLRRASRLILPAFKQGGGIKKTLRKAWRILRQEGFVGIRRVFQAVALYESPQVSLAAQEIPAIYRAPITLPADKILATRALIIGEMSIPQCKKYRIQQKQEMFELLGVQCKTLDWTESSACIEALQTHSLVIFYRVPAYDSVVALINEAKRLRIPTFWEVDDVIFDSEVLRNSKTLATLDKATFEALVEGADLYRKAMMLCGQGIASTTGLAKAMSNAGLQKVDVIENGLDRQSMAVADRLLALPPIPPSDIIRIVYGSGTNTHNVDFLEAAPAIISILDRYPNVRLRLIGMLDLPVSFEPLVRQIERIAMCTYEEYLTHLYDCDINIAPLENYIFNDSKSNIKFLEAAMLRLPSVCSPRAAFSSAIIHGKNGYLCETIAEWKSALEILIIDKSLRQIMGDAAHTTAIERYHPKNIAKQQLLPLLSDHLRPVGKIRLLSVNCFYKPRSFGGATIVAEEVNKILNEKNGFEVHVLTALSTSIVEPYKMKRYEADGINIFGFGLPDVIDDRTQFDNKDVSNLFLDVLDAVQPQVVHFHSIQGIGIQPLELCKRKGIRCIVTLHDAWWLCGRQFMINKDGKYCNQSKIDLEVCGSCVNNKYLNNYRSENLRGVLNSAEVLLAPSQFFVDFYKENGFLNVALNKNGILKPAIKDKFRKNDIIRFGYVGGNTPIKGFNLVKKVFAELDEKNVKLVVVDNAMNLGKKSYADHDLFGISIAEIVPAYTQATMDDFFDVIDVLLFPTQCKESFGLTVREALARNVWVISTDAGGAIEDISHGLNGMIVPFEDEGSELKKAVIETISYFKDIKVGQKICLENTNIRYFDEQARELISLLSRFDQNKSHL